jgi:hypothetical protein
MHYMNRREYRKRKEDERYYYDELNREHRAWFVK